MAINFTKNVEQYTTAQRNTRVKHFMEFTSKKQLENADVLNKKELDFVKSVKGTFSFSLHEDERYMAITLYKASAERKYNFLVVDLHEMAIAEADSIKQAKAEILELVLADKAKGIIQEELGKDKEYEESETADDAEEASDEELAKEA